MHTNPNGLKDRIDAMKPQVNLTNAECRSQNAECLKEKGSGFSRADGVTLGVAANKSTERIDAFIRSRFLLRKATGGGPE